MQQEICFYGMFFICFHPICISFNQAMLRKLEQIKNHTRIETIRNKWSVTQVYGKTVFNDSYLSFIFSK